MVQRECERWGATGEASLARPPLTSCCAAQFLTARGTVPICGPGLGTPVLRDSLFEQTLSSTYWVTGPCKNLCDHHWIYVVLSGIRQGYGGEGADFLPLFRGLLSFLSYFLFL